MLILHAGLKYIRLFKNNLHFICGSNSFCCGKLAKAQLNFHHWVILIYWGCETWLCSTHGFDFFQAGLRAGSWPRSGGAISLTQEFPPLSSHIRDVAPYGRQILMLASEWLRIIDRYLCAWRKDIFFKVICFGVLSVSTTTISQRNRCLELACVVADTSHAKCQTLSIFGEQPVLVQLICGTRTSGSSDASDAKLVVGG